MDSLDRIYRAVPDAGCKGLCHSTCGPIPVFDAEAKRITERHGSIPNHGADLTCDKLIDGKCSIYADRPLICRLWGVVDEPRVICPWGCKPERYLANRESVKLLRRAQRLLP